MSGRKRPRDFFAHVNAPKLPAPAEVWQLREAGTPVPVIARRYGVSAGAVRNSLARYRIKNGLEPLPKLTLKRYLEMREEL